MNSDPKIVRDVFLSVTGEGVRGERCERGNLMMGRRDECVGKWGKGKKKGRKGKKDETEGEKKKMKEKDEKEIKLSVNTKR